MTKWRPPNRLFRAIRIRGKKTETILLKTQRTTEVLAEARLNVNLQTRSTNTVRL